MVKEKKKPEACILQRMLMPWGAGWWVEVVVAVVVVCVGVYFRYRLVCGERAKSLRRQSVNFFLDFDRLPMQHR